jgi:hypothetical protein
MRVASAAVFLIALAAVCGCRAPTLDEPSRPPAAELAEPAHPAPAGGPGGAEVVDGARLVGRPGFAVELRHEGLSPLYRSFFNDATARRRLTAALSQHLDEERVTVVVAWDEDTVTGRIRLLTTARESAVAALAQGVLSERRLDPRPVAPLMAALGDYRAAMGANFDLRLLAFHLELAIQDPSSARFCRFRGLKNDPEGHGIDRCLICSMPDGEQAVCAESLPGALERAPAAVESMLARCLGGG